MNAQNLKRLNEAVLELFAPGLSVPDFPARAAQAARAAISCDLCTFGTLDPDSRKLEVFFDAFHADLPSALEGYAAHMEKYSLFHYDPWVAGGKPFIREDFYSRRQFRDLDIYCEAFRVAGLWDHAAVPVLSGEKEILFLGIERTSGPSFNDGDREILAALQPHLQNARRIACARSRIDLQNIRPAAYANTGLTPRESETFCWLVQGKSNPEIAVILGLSVPTVKEYIAAIFQKLGVENRHSAMLRGLEIAASHRPRISEGRSTRVTLPS